MPVKIFLPALSPTMTEGTLAKWLKKEGETVNAGDIIAEIETDKATMEIEAVDEGKLGKILIAEGTEGIPVNTLIAVILEEGEADSLLDSLGTNETSVSHSPAANPEVVKENVKRDSSSGPTNEDKQEMTATKTAAKGDRIFVSPLAKRMAQQAGLNLSRITGTGPNGRIVKADIEVALLDSGEKDKSITTHTDTLVKTTTATTDKNIPNTNMRKTIAKRLSESKQTIPHFYLTVDCEIDRLIEVREELNKRSDSPKLSINDFIIRATALALRRVPEANASWTDEATILRNQVDISIAVAIDGGLITPIIFNADVKGLLEISNEVRDLADRARSGSLKPHEYQGGSFSISNLGMYGIKEFSAVINPPQAGILAVGIGEERPVVSNGILSIAKVMSCTLSCDHRVIDGAIGAKLLRMFKGFVQDPLTMLL